MSKANSPIKVLRTALKRVQKAWRQGAWSEKGDDGNYYVCLEGALYGYCNAAKTQAQKDAAKVCENIIFEKYGIQGIPSWNDRPNTTQEMVEEVVKLGIIRLETGGDPEDNYLDDEEVDTLLDSLD